MQSVLDIVFGTMQIDIVPNPCYYANIIFRAVRPLDLSMGIKGTQYSKTY